MLTDEIADLSGPSDHVLRLLKHCAILIIRIRQKLHGPVGLVLQIDHGAFKHYRPPIQSLHHLLDMRHLLLLGTNDPAKLVHVGERRLKHSCERDQQILDRRKQSQSLEDRGKATDRFLDFREAVRRIDDLRKWTHRFLDLGQDPHRISDRSQVSSDVERRASQRLQISERVHSQL